MENAFKLQFDSYGTAVKFLTELIFKTTWLDHIPTLLESSLYSRLKYSKITQRCDKNSPFAWFLYW